MPVALGHHLVNEIPGEGIFVFKNETFVFLYVSNGATVGHEVANFNRRSLVDVDLWIVDKRRDLPVLCEAR